MSEGNEIIWRLGSDLVAFFLWDEDAPAVRTLGEFNSEFEDVHPRPTRNLQAARKLCDCGVLIETGGGHGLQVISSQFICMTDAEKMAQHSAYGTYDFLVRGFAAVRERLGRGVVELEVRAADGSASRGSSFVIGRNTLVTAKHCISGARKASAVLGNTKYEPIQCLESADGSDLAILLFDDLPPLPALAVAYPQPLAAVVTMGYPRLPGFLSPLLASTGELSGSGLSFIDKQTYWLTTCAMTGGSSGGPVVNAEGFVVGVVSAFAADDDKIDPGRFGIMVPANLLVERRDEIGRWAQGGQRPTGFTDGILAADGT